VRLDITPASVILTLSKRNLLALLQKADDPLSQRRLVGGYVYEGGKLIDGIYLVVGCEPDEQHYVDRQPGAMHPRTEEFIARVTGSDGSRN
jgi:hypothetical protein